ncbi:Oxoglutarate/iron-dependent dioxygenase [Penicillium bovifimosum]|uniref:Oxoglutarate/iron-dependent dioxygenase n=1 Tax=Penicillium bovifimosum TaxID=126998 RepID=A0A9W9GU46_9EURO|nr:Oxoglutarate/iron-dependent dioxygenase [Penicillium bovifimosum]KAJ5130027.1 Oxoglutarate/iron-dependent dioxygenase [Penicillium bovifimosum]
MAKRTLDAFFKPSAPPPKRPKTSSEPTTSNSTTSPEPPNIPTEDPKPPSQHPSYPFPIPQLPSHISIALEHATPATQPKKTTNQPHLDLLTFQPYIARQTSTALFTFLLQSLPFYRVTYKIRRGPTETQINTPRFTTVFGVDSTSTFAQTDTSSPLGLLETHTNNPVPKTKYQCVPRPIPACLDLLRRTVEKANTDSKGRTPGYNFCLVNYYASGEDSIAFHSDDERFLGAQPNIASLSLGGERDFLMKHKPFVDTGVSNGAGAAGTRVSGTRVTGVSGTVSGGGLDGSATTPVQQIKMKLGSGDMVVMRGETQANWLHSIPKRKGRAGEMTRGRINITFRRAVVPGGTDNYYRYNVGSGGMYRWDEVARKMVLQDDGKTC